MFVGLARRWIVVVTHRSRQMLGQFPFFEKVSADFGMMTAQQLRFDFHQRRTAIGFRRELLLYTFHGSREDDLADVVQQTGGKCDVLVVAKVLGDRLGGDGRGHRMRPQFGSFDTMPFLIAGKGGCARDSDHDIINFARSKTGNRLKEIVGGGAATVIGAVAHSQDIRCEWRVIRDQVNNLRIVAVRVAEGGH